MNQQVNRTNLREAEVRQTRVTLIVDQDIHLLNIQNAFVELLEAD